MQSQSFFGADTAMHMQLMRYLSRTDIELHVACTPVRDPTETESILERIKRIPGLRVRATGFGPSVGGRSMATRVWRALTQGPLLPLHLLGLAWYIRRHRIDIIHGTDKPRDSVYGVLLAKVTGAKSIVHMHIGYDSWFKSIVRWAIRNADAIVGVSEFTSRTVVTSRIRSDSVYTVLNGIDTQDERWNLREDDGAVRREFGIGADRILFGSVSRLFPAKGGRELIEAVATLLPVIPNLHLMIVGKDDPQATPGGVSFRSELEALVAMKGMQQHVTFTGFRTDVPRLMNAFDVFAMPSIEEPLGLVYLEAMALRKPVVGYRSGGVPEIVDHAVDGLLSEPDDIDGLARSLRQLAEDPSLRRRMGRAGREKVFARFNETSMASAMLAVYRSIALSG